MLKGLGFVFRAWFCLEGADKQVHHALKGSRNCSTFPNPIKLVLSPLP